MSLNRKRRVTKTVIILTMTFIILWLPVHSIGIWYRLDPTYFPQHFSLYVIKMIAHTMAYSNASVNPIIYAFSTNESSSKLLVCKSCICPPRSTTLRSRALVVANDEHADANNENKFANNRRCTNNILSIRASSGASAKTTEMASHTVEQHLLH